MQNQVQQHSYRSRAVPRQLPVLVEPVVPPSLAVLAMLHFAPVQAVPPLAGQRLRQQPLPWRVRAAGALRRLMKIQVYRHLYRSQAGPRQLPVLVEPVVPPSLAVLAMLHFAPVQAVPPLAGQRLRQQPLP